MLTSLSRSFTPNDPVISVPKAVRPEVTGEIATKKLTISTGHSNPLLHAAVIGAANTPRSTQSPGNHDSVAE